MHIGFDQKYKLEVVELYPGELHATNTSRIISTVLGSCVAVALRDAGAGIAGMNHFMLPGRLEHEQIYLSKSGKYGMYAMELLINEMIKLGARKKSLVAKVFGGGMVLMGLVGSASGVPQSNVSFAMKYLAAESIPVASSDVGGFSGRKVLFFTQDAKALVKKLTPAEKAPVEKEELDYLSHLRKEKKGEIVLF